MSFNSKKSKNNALVTNKPITKKHKNLADLFQHGVSLHQQGRISEARAVYQHVLTSHTQHVDALYLLGVAEFQFGNYQGAVNLYDKVISLRPNHMMAYNNLGIVLGISGQWQEALTVYDKAIQVNSSFAITFYNKGQALIEIRHFEAAIAAFDKALALQADFAEAFLNRAFANYSLKNYKYSLSDINQALKIQPQNVKALNIRGLILYGLHQINEALQDFESAVHLEPNLAEAWYNRGNILNDLKRFDDSLESFDKAFAIQPDTDFLLGTWIHSKMMVGDWTNFESNLQLLTDRIKQNKKSTASFAVLTLIDSLEVQRKAAEIWVREKFPFNPALGPIKNSTKKDKIRIGYFSPDFRNHPMAQWVAELFELHDKKKFEVFGFYFGPPTQDLTHQRIAASFTNYFDVSDKNDQEIALQARELGIDIAIDLAGFTEFSRTGIFAYRAAPIQVNYIGYPGTMGAEYIDYIIADAILIPERSQAHYSEKIIYLPNSYKPSDRKIPIADKVFNREELGLPRDGFVYCCFNNNFKITPHTFDSWMRILKATQNSVLWLMEVNSTAAGNLRKEAVQRGVNPERIVFAKRMNLSEHLARHRAADLFLDTLPYNAHTTASDALWAGLPVVTCMGESFASRVAASLLNAIELPELVTTSQEAYESLAIALSKDSERILKIKQKLARNRLTTPLFDTDLFTRHLEKAFTKIYAHYESNQSPAHTPH